MKTIYWGLLSLWLALAGCTKGVDEPTPAGATPATDETPFYGTIETDADTRCATKDSDGQIDIHWNPTDEIALFKGCPLCSCYGVQPDQNDPSHCELYFKEGAHGDQFGGATIEYDANYALHPYYADGLAWRQGRRRTDDDLLAARHAALQRRGARRASAAYR